MVLIVVLLVLLQGLQSSTNVVTRSSERKPLCGDGKINSSSYFKEYLIPTPCSKPIGIAVDNQGKVWFAETSSGKIGVFDPGAQSFREFGIPFRSIGGSNPEVWHMLLDRKNNLWFTDSTNNLIWKFSIASEQFEKYRIPTNGSFPIQLAIDAEGKVWFTEIYGNKLAVVDPDRAKDGTSQGVLEFEPPGRLALLGGVTVSNDDNVWFPMLTYGAEGKLTKFDQKSRTFMSYPLPKVTKSPVGVTVDISGKVWFTDHGTSFFGVFDPESNRTKVFATSVSDTPFPTSLPYWTYIDKHGRIWFNEHQGNKIAAFDPLREVLTEYSIPTRNPKSGNISNTLQMALAPDGKVWFTEWTENKIGVLDARQTVPTELSLNKRVVTLSKNQETSLQLTLSAKESIRDTITFEVSSTFRITGKLANFTVSYEYREVKGIKAEFSQKVLIKAGETVEQGTYTLMLGASNGEISRLVPVLVEIRG